MTNQKHFLSQIGFALSGLDEKDPEAKLTFLRLIKNEVEAQEQIIKEKMERESD